MLALTTKQFTLTQKDDSKNVTHRLSKFETWLKANEIDWYKPDLLAYRDHLLNTLAPSSARVHLSTIRSRYAKLQKQNEYRDHLYSVASAVVGKSLSDTKAFVDEMDTRLANAVNPANSFVKVPTKQDETDSDQLRLTPGQITELVNKPDTKTTKGLRDTAIIALGLCTGLREFELVALEVSDLRQRVNGAIGVLVKKGKGDKQRLIPYGTLDACLVIVDKWLKVANINTGLVFRSLTKSGKVKANGMQTRDIERMLTIYPLVIDGKQRKVRPHDLRRSYAKNLWSSGVDLLAIQQNLGHADIKTTQRYIGQVDMDKRMPTATFDLNLERFTG